MHLLAQRNRTLPFLFLCTGLFALAAALPVPAQKAKQNEFLRGICYTSYSAGSQSSNKILEWVKENHINLVVIDFFAVAYNHDQTNYKKIAKLMQRLKKEGVTILADYRPSTTTPGKGHRAEAPDLCLSDAQVRKNITGWGLYLLEQCSDIDILTVYNPHPSFERDKNCKACGKTGHRALLENFFEEWSKAIRKQHPKVKLGAVFTASAPLYRDLRAYLDVFCPFCSIIAPEGKKSCGPGVMQRVAEQMRPLRKEGPVIPLVKLYWKHETRNNTQDILYAMDEARAHGLDGFFLWYYSLITGDVARTIRTFELPEYDFEQICAKYRELAGVKKKEKKTGRRKKRRPL